MRNKTGPRFSVPALAGLLLLLLNPVRGQGVMVEELKEQTLQDSAGTLKNISPDSAAVTKQSVFAPQAQATKNRSLAVLLSVPVPGAGEYYLGRKDMLRRHLVVDGFVLASFGLIKLMQSNLRRQVRTYLATSGHSPGADTISNYSVLKIATVWKDFDTLRLEGYEPGRMDQPADYVPLRWYFNTTADWQEYKKLWNWETKFGVYAGYSLFGLAFNRIFSMVHTFQMGKQKTPEKSAARFLWNGEFLVLDQGGIPVLTFCGEF
jgi:hypothetical protein